MTLVAAFLDNGCPVLLGDLLTSAPTASPTETLVSVPLARRLDHNVPVDGGYKLVGLTQKVVIVSDRLCVAWTGPVWRADALLRYLRSAEQRDPNGSLIELFQSYPREDYGDLEMVAYAFEPGGWRWFTSPEMDSMEYGPFKTLCVGGSGRPALLETIENHEMKNFGAHPDSNPYNHSVAYTLALVGQLLAKQANSDYGLAQGWGGGFEVAYFDHPSRRFKKVNNILYLNWEVVEVAPGSFWLALLDPFVFQWTIGEETAFWVDVPGRRTDIHVVRPPWLFTASFPIPLPPPPMTFIPDYLINLYQRRDLDGTGGFGCMIRSSNDQEGRIAQINTGVEGPNGTKTNIVLGNTLAIQVAEAGLPVGGQVSKYTFLGASMPWPPHGNFYLEET